jgi:pimeloyl-ACP methyl ester carboxylesterase
MTSKTKGAPAALLSAMIVLGMPLPSAVRAQANVAQSLPPVKETYVRLSARSNALLIEPSKPSKNERILAINIHPEHNNNFEYFLGRLLVARGYRVLEVNYYGPEVLTEEFLPPLGAAVSYARTVPGVKTVVLAGHSGGGPLLSYYQEIAEKGPTACQQPDRLLPCDSKSLKDLPKADALMLLEANVGAPHRTLSLDPAVDNRDPKARNPALDMYAPQNGFDPKTQSAVYSPAFIKRYSTAIHDRSESLIAIAHAKVKAIDDHTGPFNDDEPFVVAGMAVHNTGSRLNLADPTLLSRTHGAHMELKTDGSRPVGVVHSVRTPETLAVDHRDTLNETSQNGTVRHFLSYLAITTTADFEITAEDIKGVNWHSTGNSAEGNVENISVPTLVMAGSCYIHMVPLEIVFDRSVAKDKDFVVVEGANHTFQPCRPEFGDSQKRAMDYVDTWLQKRF